MVADVDGNVLERAAQTLGDEGADVHAVVTDVTKQEDLQALFEQTLTRYGAVHTVCNNAGVVTPGNTWELTLDDWRWVIDVNVWGIIHGIRAFVPHFVTADDGHVINVVSNSALTTLPGLAPYVTSKHAALAITETLAHDLRNAGSAVRVSAVLPGPIASRMPTAFRRRPTLYGGAPDVPDLPEDTEFKFGDPPDELVERIWNDLHGDPFYVFTHEADRAMARARADAIVAGQLAAPGIALP